MLVKRQGKTMDRKIEEYKLLIDIYYKEVNLLYSKTTIFTTIQLGALAGVIAGYNFLITAKGLLSIGLLFMIFLSVIQILITIRGNTVNEALINTLSEFESQNDFTLLSDFTRNTNKIKRISKMNFPSYAMVILSVLFLISWLTILLIVLSPFIENLFELFNRNQPSEIIEGLLICGVSMLYAVTMKISDLLDEHGLKLFKGASYFFSFLCALMGCVLIIFDTIIANIVLAMVIGFVIRKRIDYNNHILAFVIITSCFFVCSRMDIIIYFPFLISILLLGFLKDTKYKTNKSKLINIVNKIYLYVPIIYALPSLFYSIATGNWLVFFVFFTYDLSYNITRLVSNHIMQNN